MNIIGNLALIITTLCYFGLASMAGKPIPGGDRGMGHALALLFLFAGLAIGILVVTVIIFLKDGFGWVSTTGSQRNSLVVVGVAALLILAFYTAMGNDGGAPWVVKFLGKYTIIWLIPPVVAGALVLLNPSLQAYMPSSVWQWTLKSITLVSVLCCVLMIGEWLVSIPGKIAQETAARQTAEDTRKQQFLADIERNNPKTEMVLILVFTTKYHDKDVREAALAKIKSNPKWQEYLVERLQTPWAGEIFPFLADNDVENKQLFAEPVKAGISMMAEKFKDGMERTHTFYDDQFYSETEAILQTIAKFEGLGVDYVPAVRKLRKALDTPLKSYQQAAHLRCIPLLDGWLKKHE